MSEVSTVLQGGGPPPRPAHSLAVGDWQPIVSTLTSWVSLPYWLVGFLSSTAYCLPSYRYSSLTLSLTLSLHACFPIIVSTLYSHPVSWCPIVSVIPWPLVGWTTLGTSAHCPYSPSLFALKFVLVSRPCLLPPLSVGLCPLVRKSFFLKWVIDVTSHCICITSTLVCQAFLPTRRPIIITLIFGALKNAWLLSECLKRVSIWPCNVYSPSYLSESGLFLFRAN